VPLRTNESQEERVNFVSILVFVGDALQMVIWNSLSESGFIVSHRQESESCRVLTRAGNEKILRKIVECSS